MRNGTYVVTRRIRMRIESWDRTSLQEQQRVIGRRKATGAPMNAQREFDPVDLAAKTSGGALVVDTSAHVRLAAPASNGDVAMLRRGYSYTDGVDTSTGELDAGLFFIAFQRDPRTAFIPIQQKLAANDGLSEYLRHTGSAVFACPPGIQQGQYLGQTLFAPTT
jgi:deferrochelatase/peroxidase EfeB